MNTIKETTLHPDGNGGVDLYPKTNINQVQELPQKLTSVENQINQLNIDKLTKPTNPTADSAVTMLTDGTVGTKPLSEIGGGGGGKIYAHCLLFTYNEGNESVAFIVYSNNSLAMTNIEPLFRKRICCAYTDPTFGGGAVWVYFEEQLTTGPKMTVKGAIQRSSNATVIDYNTTNYTMSDTVIEL